MHAIASLWRIRCYSYLSILTRTSKMGCKISSDKTTTLTELEQCTYANTPRFNFKDQTFEAKCVKVYDGDTITVVFRVCNKPYKFSIRMQGYDSPEMKSKSFDPIQKALEEKWAIASKQYLANMILDKVITLKCGSYEKYGRILGTVQFNGRDINETMLKSGYCRPYRGGRKEEWDFSSFQSLYIENQNMIKINRSMRCVIGSRSSSFCHRCLMWLCGK